MFLDRDSVNVVELPTFRCNMLYQLEKQIEQCRGVVVLISRVGRSDEEDGLNFVVP